MGRKTFLVMGLLITLVILSIVCLAKHQRVIEEDLVARSPHASIERSPAGQRDDLKKIHGIGPKLEWMLCDRGVYRSADITAWNAADIERISRYLDVFPGRILRDDWVRGARDQHHRKYGSKS